MERTLYELSSGYNSILDMVYDESMDLDALEQGLQAIEADIEVKCYNGIGLVRELESRRDAKKAESTRLSKEAKYLDMQVKRIKEWYQRNLDAMGKDGVQTKRGKMWVQNNPPALEIDDEAKIPAKYFDIVPMHYELCNERVKNDLTAGKKIPGARLTQGRSLRIK